MLAIDVIRGVALQVPTPIVCHDRADRQSRLGNQDGQFRLAHDVALAEDGSVYVVDAWGQRLQKFTPKKHRSE